MKYIKLDTAIKEIGLIGNIADFIKDIICDTLTSIPPIEVSEDAISREQLREQMFHRCFEVDNDENMQKWDSGNWIRYGLFEEELDKAPGVILKPKEGEWIYIDEPIIGNPYGRYRCSECKLEEPHKKDYCPNCGAGMKRNDKAEEVIRRLPSADRPQGKVDVIQFLEDFVKNQIINEFEVKILLEEDKEMIYVAFQKPFLTLCSNNDAMKFALTNVCMWNKKDLQGDVYNITGLITNRGTIFITSYEIQA